MPSKITLYFLAIIQVMFIGCSKIQPVKYRHETGKIPPKTANSYLENSDNQTQAKNPLGSYSKAPKSQQGLDAWIKKSISTFNKWKNLPIEEKYRIKYTKIFDHLNTALINLHKSHSKSNERRIKEIFKWYYPSLARIILSSQTTSIQREFFEKVARLKEVFIIHAQTLNPLDLKTYYQDLHIALDRMGGQSHHPIGKLYLKHAFAYFQSLTTDKNTSPQKLKLHIDFTKRFAHEFSSEELKELFPGLNTGLNYTGKNQLLLTIRGSGHFDLSPFYSSPHKRNQTAFNREAKKMVTFLRKRMTPTLIKIFNSVTLEQGLGPIQNLVNSEYELLAFMILLTEITQKEIDQIWKATDQNTQSMSQAMDLAYKVTFIQKSILSFSNLSAYIKEQNKKRDKNFFEKALAKGQISKGMWLQYAKKIRKLAAFAKTLRKHQVKQEVSDLLSGSLSALEENINVSVVYPQMMMMVYSMGDLDLGFKFIDIFGQEQEIKPDQIIHRFFSGDYFPWFNYGNGNLALSSAELSQSYMQGLRLGLFKVFSGDLDENKLLVNFIKFVSRALLEVPKGWLEMKTREIIDGYFENPRRASFLNYCRAAQGQSISQLTPILFNELEINPYLGGFSNEFLDKTKPGLKVPFKDHTDILERTRLNITQSLDRVKQMIQYYQLYLENEKGISPKKATDLTRKVSLMLDQYDSAIALYLGMVFKSLREFGNCKYHLVEHSRKISNKIFTYEKAYLIWLYGRIQAVKEGHLNSSTLTENLQSKPLTGFKLYDSVNSRGELKYHKFDFLVRIHRYLTEGLKLPNQSLPALAPEIDIDFSDTKSITDSSSYARHSRLLNQGEVRYTQNSDHFVREVFSHLMKKESRDSLSTTGFLTWMNSDDFAGDDIENDKLIEIVAILQKFGSPNVIGHHKCHSLTQNPQNCEIKTEKLPLDEAFNWLHKAQSFFHISPGEGKLYQLLGVEARLSGQVPSNLLYNHKNEIPMGQYDYIYEISAAPQAGKYGIFSWEPPTSKEEEEGDVTPSKTKIDTGPLLENNRMLLGIHKALDGMISHIFPLPNYYVDVQNDYIDQKLNLEFLPTMKMEEAFSKASSIYPYQYNVNSWGITKQLVNPDTVTAVKEKRLILLGNLRRTSDSLNSVQLKKPVK